MCKKIRRIRIRKHKRDNETKRLKERETIEKDKRRGTSEGKK